MKPLIDGDILVYQAAFGGEMLEEDGEKVILGFDYVAALLDKAVADICLAVGATEEPIIYLTGDENFRDKIAITKPYKGNRTKPKPFHYANARAYLLGLPNTILCEGIEADDAMALEQMRNWSIRPAQPDQANPTRFECLTVICTRDKDLRMVPGWHYGWEHGLQPEFHLQWVDDLGTISYDTKKNKLSGTGMLFFYSQLITGDSVDNIPGLPKKGPKAAWNALSNTNTKGEAFEAVRELYREVIGDDWRTYMLEQGQLLWMVRELDEEGQPVMWEIPDDKT